MNLFKTLWLTSAEREALNKFQENLEEIARLREQLAQQRQPVIPASETATNSRPYRSLIFSNGNITAIFHDGSAISKSGVTADILAKIKGCKTEKEIIDILQPPIPVVTKPVQDKVETKEEKELVSKNLRVLLNHADFKVVGSEVSLKGVNLAMPAPVVASFIEVLEKLEAAKEKRWTDYPVETLEDQYTALKMFWLKLALNTLPQSREDLLVFVRKNNVKITRNGNLILYRRIVSKEGADTELVTFVTQEYYRIKKLQGDPTEYAVGKNNSGYYLYDLKNDPSVETIKELLTNLQQAYLELPKQEGNTFTAWHDKNVEIKFGSVYKIPDNKINLNNTICAAGGLHAAAVDYNYSGFGDLPIVVLVNPSKAITVPMGETGKLRTTEMFIACVNSKPHGVHFDEDALAAFDTEYHDFSLAELEEAAKTKSFDKLSVQETVPAVSLVDLNAIKDMLKKRVTQVV